VKAAALFVVFPRQMQDAISIVFSSAEAGSRTRSPSVHHRWDRDLPWRTPLLNHSRCEQVEIQRVDESHNSLSIQIQSARVPKYQFKSGKKEACCGGLACVRGCWWATIVRGVLRLGTAGSCKSRRGEGTIIISGPARVWVPGDSANHSSSGHQDSKKKLASNWDAAVARKDPA
jgi:hypothetical protein